MCFAGSGELCKHTMLLCVLSSFFSLLGKMWATARQGLSHCHLLHIFFLLTYRVPSSSVETYVFTIHGEQGTTSRVTASSLLFQDIFDLQQYFLCYQEIKFGKGSEAAPKGFELSVDGAFIFYFILFSLISFSFYVWGLLRKVWFSLNPVHLNSNTS